MPDLATQFADILHRGDPQFAQSLADALGSMSQDGGGSTKAEANYQSKSDTDQMCSNCKHYQGNNACDVVSGTINPHGISDLYETKDGGSDTQSGDTQSSNSPAPTAPPSESPTDGNVDDKNTKPVSA